MLSVSSLTVSLDVLPLPLFLLGSDGKSGAPNRRWRQRLGEGRSWADFLPPPRQESWMHAWDEARKSGRGFRFDTLLRSGDHWERYLLSVEPQSCDEGVLW